MGATQDAWDTFDEYIRQARERMGDRWAPVAMICLQARDGTDGDVLLEPEKDGSVIWPASFPIPLRGPLLDRLAKPYADGAVLRS